MDLTYLGEPCRNFCFLGAEIIKDPVDALEKVVLSSCVMGGKGRLVFLDPENNEGESLELPEDEGAWALLNLNNESLLVGTCGQKGYLHRLDLKSRRWADSLRHEEETYIWNFVSGPDGMVYGGTYPGCKLLRYNPAEHVLESMGRMSAHKANLYSRMVYAGVSGRIFISCGCDKTHVAVWDMKTHEVKAFGREGAAIKEVRPDYVCTVTGDETDFYDPVTLEYLASASKEEYDSGCIRTAGGKPIRLGFENTPVYGKNVHIPANANLVKKLSKGNITGVRGQEYFVLKKGEITPGIERIPVEAPPTRIMTITADPDDVIWGSSSYGQTIFRYDPKNGTYWNSPCVCDSGGEVYGIRYIKGKLFMSAYGGGDHIVYDPSVQWDQLKNANPRTLRSVKPELVRPHAKSTVGPDGAFWTGWTAKYGTYGGGISRVDPETLEVSSWYDPVPNQNIESIAAGNKYLYFTTGGFGNGLPVKSERFHLCVWDMDGRIVWDKKFGTGEKTGQTELPPDFSDPRLQFESGETPGLVAIAGDYGMVCVGKEIRIFECASMEFKHSIRLKSPCTCMTKINEDMTAAFIGNDLFVIIPAIAGMTYLTELPGPVGTAAADRYGNLYFACGSGLYKTVIEKQKAI